MKQLITLIIVILFPAILSAQPSQTIRGVVTDKETKTPLIGATVVLLHSDPLKGTMTDKDGSFSLGKISLGRQSILVTYMGYKSVTFNDIILNSVKEVVIDVEMEENVIVGAEIEVKAAGRKDETINRMASVSARSFTVEETEKYAGSRGDVARMAANFAGVSSANDQRNDIVIRGNSPAGLLWRLEGVDIPNPNHFAEGGTTGGPVGMLNNNVLKNSDFFTGAFPAEYGNAMSGVFDLRMRNGNNQKHENLFQVGFNGFEAGAEGPFSKEHKSSYLANFRYSTLQLVSGIIKTGTAGVPKYQDFTFKLNFPLKNGGITAFGLGGNSEIAMLDSKNGDMYTSEGQDLYNRSRMGAVGITFTQLLNSKSHLKFTLSGIYQSGGTKIDTLDNLNNTHPSIDHSYAEFRASIGGYLQTKYNTHLTTKYGFLIDRMGYNLLTKTFEKSAMALVSRIDDGKSLQNGINLYQPYFQATYRFNDKLSIVPGIHYSYFSLNGASSLEPRLGLNWQLSENQKLSLGYGLHSKTQTLSTYFLGTRLNDGSLIETNKKLGLTKSNQFVLGYDLSLSNNLRLKTETYYQRLFNVPVTSKPSSFSMLNTGANWGISEEDSLVNKGTGSNYGIEFTLERFFNHNFYYLTTLSLFDSKYKGSDGIQRNTAFNGNYVMNFLVGKEVPLKKNAALNFDFKLSYAGGKRYTPVDLAASRIANTTKYIESQAFSQQFNPFLKADIKVGYRKDSKKISQEWIFYIENFTNHTNVFTQLYSPSKNEVKNINQLGIFPMMQYRLHF